MFHSNSFWIIYDFTMRGDWIAVGPNMGRRIITALTLLTRSENGPKIIKMMMRFGGQKSEKKVRKK